MSDDAYQAHGLESWAPAMCALLAVLFGLAFALGGEDFCLDDAWIHLSYAKSVGLGDGLSYNPGDHETGFSSPLWVLCLVLWPTGNDPVLSVKLLGVLFHALCAWIACALVLEMGHRRASLDTPQPLASMGLVAGLLVASQSSALRGATSGMEVSLCAALLLAVGLSALRRQWVIASALAALAVWARPEALAFLTALGVGLAVLDRQRGALLLPFGGALALVTWTTYCFALSGHAWPNTFYIKTAGEGDSLAYLLDEVLTEEAWFVGVGGIVLGAAAMLREYKARRYFAIVWFLAWAASMVAIALSRPLHPGVLFFEARYFFILSAPPLVLVALGLPDLPRTLAAVALAAVFAINGLAAVASHGTMRDQERSVSLLHTAPAKDFATLLPADARIFVEGAGATRYFASREVEIIDALGLNRKTIAHAPDDRAKACELVRAAPTHALLPDHIAQPLTQVFEWRQVRVYLDPDNAMVRARHPVQVQLYEIVQVREVWRDRCR
jgi:hypothetical protein